MNTILIGITAGFVVVWIYFYNFTGLGDVENYTGGRNAKNELYPEKCINGIVYYNQGFSLAIAGKPNGMFYTCKRK